ncbi:hypothetical protein D3C76_1311770 [compost metagenome]
MPPPEVLELILVVLLDRQQFEHPLLHLVGVVGVEQGCIQGALVDGQLPIDAGTESLDGLVILLGLLQFFQLIQLGGQAFQALLLLFAQTLQVARLKLELELGNFGGLLALVGLGVNQRYLPLVSLFSSVELAL